MCSFHGKLPRPTAGTAGDPECHTRTNHRLPVTVSQAALAQRGRLPTCAPPLGLLSVVAVTIALSSIELFRWPADPDRGAVGPERRKRLDRTMHCEEPSTRPLCRCGTTPPLVQACTPLESENPTLWGTNGPARSLDALLHKGRTPWAIEIKVDIDGSGTGIGGYCRHAISQAVLYRQFIRAVTPLHGWFQDQDLDAEDCRAAVVVPDLTADNARRDHRVDLQSICQLFDVELIEVNRQHAVLR